MIPTLKETIESLRLIRVIYGDDSAGLVSLTLGTLLADTQSADIYTPKEIPSITIADHEMQAVFGDEHNWDNLIGWLRKKFHWEMKLLVPPEATRCANCKYFNDVVGLNGKVLLSNVCTAPLDQGKVCVVPTTPSSECELFTRSEP